MYHILKCYSYNYCKNKNLFLYTSDIQELLENGSMTTNFSSQHFYLFFCIFISFHMVLTQWFYFWTQSFMSLRTIVILSEESNWFRFTGLKMKIDEFLSIYQWISFNYVKIFLIQILVLFAILLYTFFFRWTRICLWISWSHAQGINSLFLPSMIYIYIYI